MKSRNVARPCGDQRVAEQSCTAGFALDASVWAIITHAAASDEKRAWGGARLGGSHRTLV
jgi:hypothetical protein